MSWAPVVGRREAAARARKPSSKAASSVIGIRADTAGLLWMSTSTVPLSSPAQVLRPHKIVIRHVVVESSRLSNHAPEDKIPEEAGIMEPSSPSRSA